MSTQVIAFMPRAAFHGREQIRVRDTLVDFADGSWGSVRARPPGPGWRLEIDHERHSSWRRGAIQTPRNLSEPSRQLARVMQAGDPRRKLKMLVTDNYTRPTRFLKPTDLDGVAAVKIESVESKTFRDLEEKLVLTFSGREKQLVLNATNAFAIADAFGNDTEFWVGKYLKLIPVKTKYNGDDVGTIKVEIPEGQPQQQTVARPAPALVTMDDEIPF